MRKPIFALVTAGSVAALAGFLALNFLPMISTEKYDISVDPIIIKDEMGIETHVSIKNIGSGTLTNIKVGYGGSTKSDTISILSPGEKVSLSPPEGSELTEVRVTADQGINITKEYRTPASASFVGNSGYGG